MIGDVEQSGKDLTSGNTARESKFINKIRPVVNQNAGSEIFVLIFTCFLRNKSSFLLNGRREVRLVNIK